MMIMMYLHAVGLGKVCKMSGTVTNGDGDNCMHTCMLLRSWLFRLHKMSDTIANDDDDDDEDDDVPACWSAAGQWSGCRHANSSAASLLRAVRSA